MKTNLKRKIKIWLPRICFIFIFCELAAFISIIFNDNNFWYFTLMTINPILGVIIGMLWDDSNV